MRSKTELLRGVRAMKPRSSGSGLWIAWAKKTSPLFAGVTENDVRDAASDRLHPVKQARPVASGRVSPGVALGVAVPDHHGAAQV